MTSKSQHVQDNAVVERRLRPIYDWLDIGNNKKALQECDKVLKKTPNLHCAKALKALTLHRMGKEQMAIQILDDLTAEKPIDDATLQAMTLCYRELQQLDKICKLYETAVKLDPNNEELHTHLFMSYARIFDFKSQQQTAMQLYKYKPKTPYYCWAVMSLILQATRGGGGGSGGCNNTISNNGSDTDNDDNNDNDTKKRLLLLNLAERMMDKLIIDNKLDAEQEIQLYLMILELQNKFNEIIKFLDGPLGNKLITTNQPQYRIKFLKKLQLWHDINLLCKTILVDNIDRWDIWKEYINSVFELLDQKTTNNHDNHETTTESDNDTVDDTPEKCHEFICRIVENTSDNGYILRGPYLARFELCKKLLQHNIDPTDLLGDLIELFIEYFRKFGHKSCCITDLRLYLNLLNHNNKKFELSTKLLKDVDINIINIPKNQQQMQRHLTALQLTRLCGIHRNLTKEHLLALITSYSLHYQHGYQTYGRNLLQTDLGPSDTYAILATHLLYDLSRLDNNNNNTDSIIAGLILLETLLKNSPSNFHAKLLSIRLYHTIGGTLGAQNMYNSLDLKHLQLDSLGFIHCARLPTTGLFSLYTNLCDATLKFFSSNYKDSSDHITFSYKYGSFIKLDEFMDFRERLNNSIHYTTVAIDRIVLTLMDCTNLDALYNLDISPKDDKIDWDNLRDNHDLSVYVSWDPERINCPPEEQPEIQQLFQQNVDYLKLRTNILWSLSNAVFIIKSTDGIRQKHIDNLNNIINDWEQLIVQVRLKNYTPLRQDLVTLPLPSRLHAALDVNHFDILIDCFKIFYNIANENYLIIDDLLNKIEKSFKDLLNNLKDKSQTNEICTNLIQRRILMEFIVNSVEIFSISCLICLLCNNLSKPLQQSKKNRKQQQQQHSGGGVTTTTTTVATTSNSSNNVVVPSSRRRECLINFVNFLKTSMNQLNQIVENLSNHTITYDLTKFLETLNLNNNDDNNSNVNDNIMKSYQYACREIQRVLQSKLKMLNCI